jgi:hypothetical protein
LQHYNHVANQNKAVNEAEYKKWLSSYTPVEISKANAARRSLWRQSGRGKGSLNLLKDDRRPKRPTPAYIQFCQERYRSGDLKHLSLVDAGRLSGREWKELNEADKQVRLASVMVHWGQNLIGVFTMQQYRDAYAKQFARYAQEVRSLLDRDVDSSQSSSP